MMIFQNYELESIINNYLPNNLQYEKYYDTLGGLATIVINL